MDRIKFFMSKKIKIIFCLLLILCLVLAQRGGGGGGGGGSKRSKGNVFKSVYRAVRYYFRYVDVLGWVQGKTTLINHRLISQD